MSKKTEFSGKHVEARAPLRPNASEMDVLSPSGVRHAAKSPLVSDFALGLAGLEQGPAYVALNGNFCHEAMATQRHTSHFALTVLQPYSS